MRGKVLYSNHKTFKEYIVDFDNCYEQEPGIWLYHISEKDNPNVNSYVGNKYFKLHLVEIGPLERPQPAPPHQLAPQNRSIWATIGSNLVAYLRYLLNPQRS